MILHDTLTNERREFTPYGDEVRMYVCGVTPYSESHVGHALKSIVFDVLRRYLEWRGYRVRHVENFTDIDDKLIARSQDLGLEMAELAERNIEDYQAQLMRMNVLPAHEYPRVTEMIPAITRFIATLIEHGHAYPSGGDVYYRVRSFPAYGRLSKRDVDDLLSGARVDLSELKDDPLDFALWKGAKPGEPAWDSPWGPGRPGWHIECSAMSMETLGEQIDIHGGGADLIFPHHENEIAQSEGHTGKPFAQFWIHNALLQMGGEKMSKSVGNIVSIGETLERYGADAFRLLVLQSHYRSPVTYGDEAMEAAAAGASRLRASAFAEARGSGSAVSTVGYRERFIEAMDDDLNTPRAMAVLFDLSREINRGRDAGREIGEARALLAELAGVVGLQLEERERGGQEAAPFIDLLLELRRELRTAQQYELADRIRNRLTELQVEVQDGPQGSTWEFRG